MKKFSESERADEALRINALLNNKVFVFDKNKYLFIPLEDILRFESDNSYTKIILLNRKLYFSSKPILKYEKELKDSFFLRIHQSHLINLNQIDSYYRHPPSYIILTNNEKIPVSKEYSKIFNHILLKIH